MILPLLQARVLCFDSGFVPNSLPPNQTLRAITSGGNCTTLTAIKSKMFLAGMGKKFELHEEVIKDENRFEIGG